MSLAQLNRYWLVRITRPLNTQAGMKPCCNRRDQQGFCFLPDGMFWQIPFVRGMPPPSTPWGLIVDQDVTVSADRRFAGDRRSRNLQPPVGLMLIREHPRTAPLPGKNRVSGRNPFSSFASCPPCGLCRVASHFFGMMTG